MVSTQSQRATRIGIAASVAMIAQQVAAKATRDALFLSSFDPGDLLLAMIGTAALSVAVAMAMAGALSRLGPARVVPVVFLLHAAFFLFEWRLVNSDAPFAAIVLYLHVGALGATAISGFWSVVNERFDPHAAKGAIGAIGIGATIGGVAGGVLAERVSDSFGVVSVLPVLAGLNVACAALVAVLGRDNSRREPAARDPSIPSTLGSLIRTPLLRKIAALVVLTGITSAIFDYTLKAEAHAAFASPEQLARFFAVFYTGVSVLTFVVQAALGTRILQRMGLSATIALLPASVLLSSVLGAAVQKLWSAVIAAGTEYVLRSSVYRAGYELLYTPMAPASKRPAKALIDVGFDRLGDALGAGMLLAVVALLPLYAKPVALLCAGVAALLALVVALQIHKDYVEELARSLRNGVVQLDPDGVLDATTMQTLADTATAISRDELLAEIDKLRKAQQAEQDSSDAAAASPLAEERAAHAVLLSSGDTGAIIELLDGTDFDSSLVAFAIPLIDDPRLANPALGALERIAPGIVGQLGDAVLDHTTPLATRIRLAHVLGRCATGRARDALLETLSDESFELRYHAVQALLFLVQASPELTPDPELLMAAALRELDVDNAAFRAQHVTLGEDDPVLVDRAIHAKLPHAVEHVVATLAVVLEREPLRLCLTALHARDEGSRGTALEYLQNVLPPPLYAALQQKLPPAGTAAKRAIKRDRQHIVEDLVRSTGGD